MIEKKIIHFSCYRNISLMLLDEIPTKLAIFFGISKSKNTFVKLFFNNL